MNRQKIIAGNWKMHKTVQEAVDFIHLLTPKVTASKALVFLAVPFTAIGHASAAAGNTNIIIGAQNMHSDTQGAYTGEISSLMLREQGAEFVILGHSERRHIFLETDAFINLKVIRALQDDLIPILCVGETEHQREQNLTHKVLKEQIEKGLHKIPEQDVTKVVLAYEPVWAIGTGKVATPQIAQEAHHHCRNCLSALFSKSVANKISILYGGSVKPENIASLVSQEDVDGALVGGASLDPKIFSEIINHC